MLTAVEVKNNFPVPIPLPLKGQLWYGFHDGFFLFSLMCFVSAVLCSVLK